MENHFYSCDCCGEKIPEGCRNITMILPMGRRTLNPLTLDFCGKCFGTLQSLRVIREAINNGK